MPGDSKSDTGDLGQWDAKPDVNPPPPDVGPDAGAPDQLVKPDAATPLPKIGLTGSIKGMAYVSGYLWVGHTDKTGNNYRVIRVDTRRKNAQKHSTKAVVAQGGLGLTLANGKVWVADSKTNKLVSVDPNSWKTSPITLTTGKNASGLTWDGVDLWISDPPDNKFHRVSTTGANSGSIPFVGGLHLAMEWDGVGVWSNQTKLQLARYDPFGGVDEKDTITGLPTGSEVADVAIGDGVMYVSTDTKDVYFRPWARSCTSAFSESFIDSKLPGWSKDSLIQTHSSILVYPKAVGGEYKFTLTTSVGAGHHRKLSKSIDNGLFEVRASVQGAPTQPGQVMFGLFKDDKLHSYLGAKQGTGYACAWQPQLGIVTVDRLDGASGMKVMAQGAMPLWAKDGNWHDVACRHNPDGAWSISVDGVPLALNTNAKDTTYRTLTHLSIFIDAKGSRKMRDLQVMDCDDIDCLPGKVTKSCQTGDDGVQWCKVPAGCFPMGSPLSESCRSGGTEVRHDVRLSNAFRMSRTEVTQAQYQGLTGANPSQHGPAAKPPCSKDCPVEKVSWHEAARYCNLLSARDGRLPCYTCVPKGATFACTVNPTYTGKGFHGCPGYRLPTEAEWEYAYRAGSPWALYNGALNNCTADPNAKLIAWYKATSKGMPEPVGTRAENKLGLQDMAGNVREFCQDNWKAHLGAAPQTDPLTLFPSNMVVRGGHYGSDARDLRAAARTSQAAATPTGHTGFRCAVSVGRGPVAHWKLDEGQGLQAENSGAGKAATLKGITWVTGVLGTAARFDGVTSSGNTAFKPVLTPLDSFSLSLWFNTTASSSVYKVHSIARFEATKMGAVGLSADSKGDITFIVQDDGGLSNGIDAPKKLNDGNWHHVVGVRDVATKQLHLYIDGVKFQSKPDKTTSVINDAKKLSLGMGASNSSSGFKDHFKGDLDDMRFYKRALSLAEVKLLHAMKSRCNSNEHLYRGHCYRHVDTSVKWDTAKAKCALTAGAYMVTIGSSEENNFVKSLTPKGTWIGYTDKVTEGSWQWVNGDPSSYTKWCASLPPKDPTKDCAKMVVKGCRDHSHCASTASPTMHYVCERLP